MSKILNYIENFYSRMEIKSHKHFIIIMIIFAITGSLALFLTIQILSMMHLKELVSPIIFWPLRIIILFIIYQITLILVAIPFGEFNYFLKFVSKFLKRLGIKI